MDEDEQALENCSLQATSSQVMSNGRYKSAWHRVLAIREGNRRSIASFYNLTRAATIAPAIPAADSSTGADYPSFSFGDYMEVYLEQKFQDKEPRFTAAAAMTNKTLD